MYISSGYTLTEFKKKCEGGITNKRLIDQCYARLLHLP